MSAAAAIRRLAKEQQALAAERVCDFYAEPLPMDMFQWHFTLQGPCDTPYAKGLYHGALRFPRNYPFSPPDIVFFTPSGRFDVNKNICSSISSYHPELWNPTYTVPLVLVALRVFMSQDDEIGIGLLEMRYISKTEKIYMAERSHTFACPDCGMTSAHALWETQMKGHPPSSPDLEVSVPKIPAPNPATVSTPDTEKEKEKEKEHIEGEGTRCSVPGPLTSSEEAPAQQGTFYPSHSATNSSPVLDTATPPVSAFAKDTEEERKDLATAAEVLGDNVSASPAPVAPDEASKATSPVVTQEVLTSGAGEEAKGKDKPIIRLRLGGRVICRMEVQHLNCAIVICFVMFFSLLLKKCFAV